MKKGTLFCLILIILTLAGFCGAACGYQDRKSELQIHVQTTGIVRLTGDIAVNDSLRLYSREYHSSEHIITDRLLSETTADTSGSAAIAYNPYGQPLSETKLIPDFEYAGNEISIKALYAVVSDGSESVRSKPAYLEVYLNTGVVDQHLCTLAASTACGTAAGLLAMQIAYPAAGTDLLTRMNDMRNYCTLGSEFSTGPSEYYLEGTHISNGVNKYVAERLSGSLKLKDHRSPEKTTEETLIELLSTGRPAVIEVCYLLGNVTRDFQGISHWITINGFSLGADGYTFRFSDPITASYRSISSEMLDTSNANVSYGNSGYIPVRYIGAFSEPLFSIE